jgi:hypothetical protein
MFQCNNGYIMMHQHNFVWHVCVELLNNDIGLLFMANFCDIALDKNTHYAKQKY